MNKTIAIATGSALMTGFLGMGVGYLSADGMPDVQTKTVTHEVASPTHTIVKWKTKRVEVPGPTQVKWKTRTKVETQQVTPQACLDAIDDAENIARNVASFTKVVVHYPTMVGEAYKAGLNMDGTKGLQIARHMKRLSQQMESINNDTAGNVDQFNTDKTACRSH